MKKKFFINNPKVYFIAEIGINHNGNVKNALKLIEEAKKHVIVLNSKKDILEIVCQKMWNIKNLRRGEK